MVYLLFFVFSPHLGLHHNTTPHPHILDIPRPASFVVLCKKRNKGVTLCYSLVSFNLF